MLAKPWSHRLPRWAQHAVTLISAAVYAIIGTFVHRAGADYIPYGMLLALTIVACSAFSARARLQRLGLLEHLLMVTLVAWYIALSHVPQRFLVPIGFTINLPWMAQHAGYVWLYGLILVQAVQLVFPSQWFIIHDEPLVCDNETNSR